MKHTSCRRGVWVAVWSLPALSGLCAADTLRVPAEFSTIQAAIDASADGDTVLVADGVYSGPGNRDLDFGGRAIEVRSENGARSCVIDARGNPFAPARCFWFGSGETGGSVLRGFTLTGGFSDRGGAVLIEAGSSPTIEACSFEGNVSAASGDYTGGGALAVYDSQPTITSCWFLGNNVRDAAFPAGGGAVYVEAGSVRIEGCDFAGNFASGSGDAGAVIIIGGSHTITDSGFTANVSARLSGAILSVGGAEVDLTGCVFDNNAAFAGGGAVYVEQAGRHTFTACLFVGNTSGDDWGGGGVRVYESAVEFIGCDFVNNISAPGWGGGLWLTGVADAVLTETVFAGNHATSAGGGLGVSSGSTAAVVNGLFIENSTDGYGGGAWAGWRNTRDARLDMVNCTVYGNQAASGGGAVRLDDGGGCTVGNSILRGNSPDEIGEFASGAVSVTYSNVEGGRAGSGNIDCDPMFAGVGTGDFSLAAGSCAIDAGDNTAVPAGTVVDLAGDARFYDDPGTADTGVPGGEGGDQIVDMGAYEFQGGACYADFNGDGAVNTQDVLAYLNAWAGGDSSADCNDDGSINTQDVLCFLNAWNAGC